jgi:uncharacterized protein (DUF1800 family)
MYGRAVALAFAISLTTAPLSAQRRPAAEDTARAVQLLGRATFGVRTRDLAEVLRVGRKAWLERQLHPETIADSALATRLAAYPATRMAPDELMRYFSPSGARSKQAAAARASGGRSVPAMMDSVRPRNAGPGGTTQRWRGQMIAAKLNRAAYSERQLEEVMTDFWFNHFNVFIGKGGIIWLAQDYEENAIRPHVFGKFEDLLVATATHPAMLIFLDNAESVAAEPMMARPASAARPARKRGLNENYARELMELHTLGVEGGYTQQDVREVARVFTGWTIDRGPGRAQGGDAHFVFRPRLHDQGEKVVRGERIAPAGQAEGLRLLHRLAHDPATAHHIARQLAEHFVSDHPDPAFVEQLAQTFLRTDGDLREVTRQLFLSEAFYAPRNRATKLKTPLELVASALRATATRVDVSPPLLQTLKEFGQVPYMNLSPTGYPASSAAWTSSGALLARMNFGLALGAGRVRGIQLDPALAAQTDVRALASRILPGRDTHELVAAVRADVQANPRSRGRALGLLLGSPDFQKK